MDGGFREWWAGLTGREAALILVVGVAVLGAAGIWWARSAAERPVVESVAGPAVGPSPSPAGLFVHVAGWVRHPGVYELPSGGRVIDAIDRAGGPRRGAVLDALNLAAVLTDGQQVMVPKRSPDGAAPTPGLVPAADGAAAKVNVNTADAATLDTLPGIGEVLAGRIIEYREQNGPFATVDELINVSGIGEVTLEELRPLVVV